MNLFGNRFLRILWITVGMLGCNGPHQPVDSLTTEVCIYGATPAGIAAAISAAKRNKQVVLIEPTSRIGGLVTNGLSHTDFHSLEALSGTFLEFTQRVKQYYVDEYGADSEQVEASYEGTFGEPGVNLQVFQQMLYDFPQIRVVTEAYLDEVRVVGSTIEEAAFEKSNQRLSVTAKRFVDATYEGDLMAMSGVSFTVGREGKDVYGESLAPETGDDQLQAYNFRFCATDDPNNRVPVEAPSGYNREDFLDLLPILDSGKIDQVFGYPPVKSIYKAQTPALPNAKYDINDVSNGIVRLSMPGYNLSWPNGTRAERQKIAAQHIDFSVGMLYFLQHDEAVPAKYREQALKWGWCKDEFQENNHLPIQLYVREARRMKGQYIYTQKDSEHQGNDARSVWHEHAIAMGDYGNNCHGTFHEGPQIGGRHVGEFYYRVPPYQVPYEVLLPKEINNLLVPVAVSASHVGFCALRLESIWTSLGQAAGHAVAISLDDDVSLEDVDMDTLQQMLHRDRLATIYVSDALPGHPDFEAVQWWGTKGGLHGLSPMNEPGERGKNLHGQYYEAAPWHGVELDRALDSPLRERWLSIARDLKLNTELLENSDTRGQFIRTANQLR